MTTALDNADPSVIAQLRELADKVMLEEFTDLTGTTRHLRAQIDRIAQIDIHRAGPDSLLEYVCELSAKTANAIARQQTANAAIMRVLGQAKTAK